MKFSGPDVGTVPAEGDADGRGTVVLLYIDDSDPAYVNSLPRAGGRATMMLYIDATGRCRRVWTYTPPSPLSAAGYDWRAGKAHHDAWGSMMRDRPDLEAYVVDRDWSEWRSAGPLVDEIKRRGLHRGMAGGMAWLVAMIRAARAGGARLRAILAPVLVALLRSLLAIDQADDAEPVEDDPPYRALAPPGELLRSEPIAANAPPRRAYPVTCSGEARLLAVA